MFDGVRCHVWPSNIFLNTWQNVWWMIIYMYPMQAVSWEAYFMNLEFPWEKTHCFPGCPIKLLLTVSGASLTDNSQELAMTNQIYNVVLQEHLQKLWIYRCSMCLSDKFTISGRLDNGYEPLFYVFIRWGTKKVPVVWDHGTECASFQRKVCWTHGWEMEVSWIMFPPRNVAASPPLCFLKQNPHELVRYIYIYTMTPSYRRDKPNLAKREI